MQISCRRCGEQFDTQRDHAAGNAADTNRCPECGASHDSAEAEAVADDGAVAIEAGEETIEVHIHLHRERGNHE